MILSTPVTSAYGSAYCNFSLLFGKELHPASIIRLYTTRRLSA